MIYIVNILLLLLYVYIEFSYPTLKKTCRILASIQTILLIGLRHTSIGVDTETYSEFYKIYGSNMDFLEMGYSFCNQIFYNLGLSANCLFIFMAFISILPIYLTIKDKELNEYTILSFAFYTLTYFFLINGIRQGVACCWFIYSIRYIYEQKLWKYLIIIFISSLFHKTVLLLIPLYFILKKELPDSLYVIIYVLSFFFVFFNVIDLFPAFTIGDKEYGISYKISARSWLGYTYSTLLNVFILFLMLNNKQAKNNIIIFNLAYIGFCMKNVGYYSPIIGRFTLYFSWFVFLLLPCFFLYDTKVRISKSIIITVVTIGYIGIYINSLTSGENKTLPYLFYWE